MRGNTRPVVIAAAVTLPTTMLADILDRGEIDAATYLGLGGIFTALAFVAEGAPDLAKGIAWLVTVVILLTRGASVLEGLGSMGKQEPANVVNIRRARNRPRRAS